MSEKVHFIDILAPAKERGIFQMMTRDFFPQNSHETGKLYSPQELKDLVAKSVYLDFVVEAESAKSGVSKEKLKREIREYLEEMGFDVKGYVIRWMGIFFLKICSMMKIGVYVNDTAVLKLKATMGKNPVLFLPTHRSYADFCLLTYLCYNYEITFPAVAAGMDFYSMAVVGQRMRETCAFYIRRTLVGAPLYAATLRQYMRTIVAKHFAPIEFFLEGTRSRSNKSMSPKYGMLSMSLVPYFAREVSDVTIVPVTITYDRLMEQSLFAFELLGVPKPKESTGGLLKSLRALNDHFGNIYINFGSFVSVKEYMENDCSVSSETLKPVDLQQLTPDQFNQVQDLANYVVTLQQKSTVATISNLLSLVLMQSLVRQQALDFEQVLIEVEWTIEVLKNLGASVFENDVKSSVERILVVHSKMMKLDQNGKLRLISGDLIDVSAEIKKKMKGHTLMAETMVNAVPIIQLQMYVNPILHYLVPPAIVYLIANRRDRDRTTTRENIASDYQRIRRLLRYEFFHIEKTEDITFNTALDYCVKNKVITCDGNSFILGDHNKLQYLLKWAIFPALTTMQKCIEVMRQQQECGHSQALKLVQERVELSRCHPYCLSLDCVANCLQGLALAGALGRHRRHLEVFYTIVPDKLEESSHLIGSILPMCNVDFGRSNPVILDFRTMQSRL